MDRYSEYLINQINYYRDLMKEDPKEDHSIKQCVIDELLQALTEYQNFKVKPVIS